MKQLVEKPKKTDGMQAAAFLIQIGIEQMQTSPTLRKRCGISLTDLKKCESIRRRLLTDSKKD